MLGGRRYRSSDQIDPRTVEPIASPYADCPFPAAESAIE